MEEIEVKFLNINPEKIEAIEFNLKRILSKKYQTRPRPRRNRRSIREIRQRAKI